MFYTRFLPFTIKFLLGSLIGFSLLFSFLLPLIPKLAMLLSLSLAGIKQYLVFQFVTYLFLVSNGTFSISFLVHLFFNAYLFWLIAPPLFYTLGKFKFLSVFFLSGIAAAITLLAIDYRFAANNFYAGNNYPLYAILLSSALLANKDNFASFNSLTLKLKYPIFVLILFALIYQFAYGSRGEFAAMLSALLFGLIPTLFVRSKFSFKRAKEKLSQKTKPKPHYKPFHETKIYDFKTQKPIIDDDEFMDAMLSKIALYGEDIITTDERRRMDKIAEKKRKESTKD